MPTRANGLPVRLVSAGTAQALDGRWYGVAIVDARDPERIRRIVWAISIRRAIDLALSTCAREGWTVPPADRWWETEEKDNEGETLL